MQPETRQALDWITLCVSVVLAVFTWLDIASGVQSTALWLSAILWPTIAALTGWKLHKNPYRPTDADD